MTKLEALTLIRFENARTVFLTSISEIEDIKLTDNDKIAITKDINQVLINSEIALDHITS